MATLWAWQYTATGAVLALAQLAAAIIGLHTVLSARGQRGWPLT
jgi:hypothetical protein